MQKRVAYIDTKAHQKLIELQASPFDLTAADALQDNGRPQRFICTSSHFDLHYWSQRVDDTILDALQELADECDLVRQYKQMKSGEIMNNINGFDSENRQVLHTSCRDIFVEQASEQTSTDKAVRELAKLKDFLEDLDSGQIVNAHGEKFESLIHVGIGGSDLGPRSIYEALRAYGKKRREVHFISNVDPDDAAAVMKRVDLSTALVNIVSKSGTTLETLTNEALVHEAFVSKGLDPAQHFIAVTGQGSPMDNPQKYLRSFYMFDFIGGRYSATSMVGLVMLGFALGNEQISDFLKGASTVDYEAEEPDIRSNQALLLAMLGIWNHSYLHMPTHAVLPYRQALHRFPAHLQQCDMESNGKSITRMADQVTYQTGPIVWGEPGTNGQHAFYQLLHQGTEIVPCDFIGFRQAQYSEDTFIKNTTSQQKLIANMLAQSVALATGQKNDNPNKNFPGNRPSSILLAEQLTPEVMGALLALYETKIVFQGFAWNINSFDQEGVQLGKILANRFLDEMASSSGKVESLESMILDIAGMA